jgi:hypothetical protein
MDRRNRRIFTAAAVLVLISLYGCEDTVAYVHNAFGGVDRLTTDSITGQTTVEHFLPPPPPPNGALKSDAGRG